RDFVRCAWRCHRVAVLVLPAPPAAATAAAAAHDLGDPTTIHRRVGVDVLSHGRDVVPVMRDLTLVVNGDVFVPGLRRRHSGFGRDRGPESGEHLPNFTAGRTAAVEADRRAVGHRDGYL